MKRFVQPELLDTLPPEDPRAARSRRDLHRVNWWMGNHAIMAHTIQKHCLGAPQQISELGAGDGNFLLRVAQRISPAWPEVTASLLDFQKNVSAETLIAFATVNWHAKTVVADVFDWSPTAGVEEVVIANLFLHHFEEARLAELLLKISRHARLFIALEPHRSASSLLAGKLLWLIGCNGVTRHDAAISIRAGFTGQEISKLWPDKTNWHLTEQHAGLFSHLFIARRRV